MRFIFKSLLVIAILLDSTAAQGSVYWFSPRSDNYNYNYQTSDQSQYFDNLPYANLTVKINRSNYDGPGQNLMSDPLNASAALFAGNTINRQTFETQFVLDMQYALGIAVNRVYVTDITPGDVHFSWDASTVIVEFVFLERDDTTSITLLEAISNLTVSIQNPNSSVYIGTNVTKDIDFLYGLTVINWDISLKLSYAIEVIGGPEVLQGYYLNQGGQELCQTPLLYDYPKYCEFERFFEDDIALALSISYYRVQILFIKRAAMDAVLVHFRIIPAYNTSEPTVAQSVASLIEQVNNPYSDLYRGNVTLRVDPVWGVSNAFIAPRVSAALFTHKYYEIDPSRTLASNRMQFNTAYDRCKANRRCNWGVTLFNQSTNAETFYHRLFDEGALFNISLFLDFEDWRTGSRGLNWQGSTPLASALIVDSPKTLEKYLPGAHFWPFNDTALGPTLPCYGSETNEGLILDRVQHYEQIQFQAAFVDDLQGRLQWIQDNIDTINMDASLRARRDVHLFQNLNLNNVSAWYQNEVAELLLLNSSQCVYQNCALLFNTSSLLLTGAINATGVLHTTANGTEVALFTFNSVYLGPEVGVTLVGQRPLVLSSRTSMVINTTFEARPGTLGGFPGGGSVARLVNESLIDNPRSVMICDLQNVCDNSRPYTNFTDTDRAAFVSNNVNGPGSGNLRVYPFVIRTSAAIIPEIQYIRTQAKSGQTLSGGFSLVYGSFRSPVVPHDVSAIDLKDIIETNLNYYSPDDSGVAFGVLGEGSAGAGRVDVTRSLQDSQEGYEWLITFTSAIGNLPQLAVVNYLEGLNANVTYGTIQQGNEIGGSFRLNFNNELSPPFYASESAARMKSKLLSMPSISSAYVTRNDPTGKCDDGLCANGPFLSRGMVWTVLVTVDEEYGNTTPYSPTSPLAAQNSTPAVISMDYSSLTGAGAIAQVYFGHGQSPDDMDSLLRVILPFSLAFGGGGGSYGGYGGLGYGENPIGMLYGDAPVTDLFGGSGGCMRSIFPFEVNAYAGISSGFGGAGGGAIELIAINDITIGSFGKILMAGGNGEQSSEGGGGGGSGGAILLAAGGTVLNNGVLDVSGGWGAYGGVKDGVILSGGGGGGGRVAWYGESLLNNGTVDLSGGPCGILSIPLNITVLETNIAVSMMSVLPLDTARLIYIAEYQLSTLLSNVHHMNYSTSFTQIYNGSYYLTVLVESVYFNTEGNASSILPNITLSNSTRLKLSEVVIFDITLQSSQFANISTIVNSSTPCSNAGFNGSFYTDSRMPSVMIVDTTAGAEETHKALHLMTNDYLPTACGIQRETPFGWNGPLISFQPAQPSRFTYYTRIDSIPEMSSKTGFGSLVALTSSDPLLGNGSSVIGVFSGERILYGSNFDFNANDHFSYDALDSLDLHNVLDKWYKVDVHLDWSVHQYYILLNDVLVTKNQLFNASYVDGIRFSTLFNTGVWFDEIYVGFDNTMRFQCPQSQSQGVTMDASRQYSWTPDQVDEPGTDGLTQVKTMSRHYSFMEPLKTIPFDGEGSVKFFQDYQFKYPIGADLQSQPQLHAGAMLYLDNTLRSMQVPSGVSATTESAKGWWWKSAEDAIPVRGRQFWYTEYDYQSDLSPTLNGGICACSSQDLVNWRFEGIVFHYTNLTDMVFGSPGPFHIEKPKVLYNNITDTYVMWGIMDNLNQSLLSAVVLTSFNEDGPFFYRRSLFPDGNITRDQAPYLTPNNQGALSRTYYQTVEYVLPEAMMQPVWESVKYPNGDTNFRNSYHRTHYEQDYDNYHDIFLQRWRKEDKPWEVICVNRITLAERVVPRGVYNSDGSICNSPQEYKVVVGQGNPYVQTNYIDPIDPANSWWMQSSVPAVRAQPWNSSFQDGLCGLTKSDDDVDLLDPNLVDFVPQDRSSCSNIADNPIHAAVQDKLVGVQQIVSRRRAKFLAVSAMTTDFMDTSGWLSSYEGEFESGALLTMMNNVGDFGFTAQDIIQSTFQRPILSEFKTAADYKIRFRQFIRQYNDRAYYSLACIIDGVCPVNYKDEITVGQV